MSESEPTALLVEFPCRFTIKAMGLATDDFCDLIVSIVEAHSSDANKAVSTRHSKNQKYLSVSITLIATSQAELDAIYRELSADQRVLMAL